MQKKGEKKNGFSPAGSPMMAHAGRLALEVLQQQSLQLFRRAGGGAGELEVYSRREEERKEEISASTATPHTGGEGPRFG